MHIQTKQKKVDNPGSILKLPKDKMRLTHLTQFELFAASQVQFITTNQLSFHLSKLHLTEATSQQSSQL